MVISVVVAYYKVEKLSLLELSLEECLGTLTGFTGEQVEIRGTIDLKTTFDMGSDAKTITIKFTIANVPTLPTLNKLQAVVSTLHMCMKYLVADQVGTICTNRHTTWKCYEASLRVGQRMEGQRQREVNSRSDVHCLDLSPH
ncbi:hypothetical protein CR513_13412, partial [Mucuna pruriens]